MENEEVIRQRMEETRESLTDKLETLEDRLIGSVDEARSAVRETVASVKETMHEGVESVKDAVDLAAHVQRHPWLMFGGAILGGYVLGTLLTRASETTPSSVVPPLPEPSSKRHSPGNGHHKQTPRRETKPEPQGKASHLLDAIEPELRQLKGLALGVALGTVRELVAKEVPPHLAGELRSIIDGVTRKMGGEPVPESDLPFTEACATETQSSPFSAEKPRW